MTDQTYKLIAMAIYMLAMLAIGWWAYRRTTDLDDYMLAGRDLKPGVAALSAGASDMSGWLLMGLPGAIYVSGLVEGWIAVGLTAGAWLNWKFVAPRLRSYTLVSNNSITVPSFLENRLKDRSRVLRVVSGLIILIFFTFYVSSGMVAGGVFFESSFGSSYLIGMLIVAGVTIAYTLFGGFLAASYTDVVQGLMMLVALVMVPLVGLTQVGGLGGMTDSLREINPDMLDPIAGGTAVGVISALAWGLGYFGQPHIIVRFMALRSPQDAVAGRRIGVAWMLLTVIGAIMTALIGAAYFQQNDLTLADPEAVFLSLAQFFFHPLVAGFVLAAVLAAIMSTISSQLIVTSSALVEDLYKIAFKRDASPRSLVMLGRMGVLLVSVVSILIALDRNASILELVGFAWAGFGAAFGPTILLALYWRRLTTAGALTGMIAGAAVAFLWGTFEMPGVLGDVYEIIPGFIINLVLTVVVSRLTYKPSAEIDAEFDDAVRIAKGGAAPAEPARV
ncbi:sodium/proline symporter PutP [Arthrobacter sp. zg-Y820]|uniref:sodium/proline symporter PutP n=1 Tax=unclassified Arthrobacter TaxID=235627 RepID=UPI001E3EF12A|nr:MULTISPECIES: sodium/proline symporter PutP [unclassified Arthrobacter]MCC9195416.1 sodium/proline symporter PutP [Arthrobacter sp. zg-Y820]MDK1278275.1 sodium/proline symporter PutP [Arthrobacter sp. zg.Y820]MDK1361241.1 sodium/proline symporter PutP [Arthrobacter sp. zg-Y1219]WIB10155.1 sodium/proline symporter PutP [Arthrobacter sp. zg-Y820]